MATALTPATAAGPYQTQAEAGAEPMPREVQLAMDSGARMPVTSSIRYVAMVNACVAAGVELGKFDAKILAWLSTYEPETCQVIIGLVSRAYAEGAAVGMGLA